MPNFQNDLHGTVFLLVWFFGPKMKCKIGQVWALKQIALHDHALNAKHALDVWRQTCNMLIFKHKFLCGTLSKIAFLSAKPIWQVIQFLPRNMANQTTNGLLRKCQNVPML